MIDYAKLEKEYMTSNVSVREIAKRHNLPQTSVQRYAKKHNWAERREDRAAKRLNKAIEQEEGAQDRAWEDVTSTIRAVLGEEWKKCLEDEEYRLSVLPSLTRSTKFAREMGVYGTTVDEKMTLKKVEALEKQLGASDENGAIKIEIEGGDVYGN